MKAVVRKKLSLSPSFPVYLSQLRDGKSVDLDDGEYPSETRLNFPVLNRVLLDDDFEAFSASARANLTVKVKVILGEHHPPPATGAEVCSLLSLRHCCAGLKYV